MVSYRQIVYNAQFRRVMPKSSEQRLQQNVFEVGNHANSKYCFNRFFHYSHIPRHSKTLLLLLYMCHIMWLIKCFFRLYLCWGIQLIHYVVFLYWQCEQWLWTTADRWWKIRVVFEWHLGDFGWCQGMRMVLVMAICPPRNQTIKPVCT